MIGEANPDCGFTMPIPNPVAWLQVFLDARRVRRRGDPEHHLLSQFVRPGDIAVDVGANHGVYTWSLMLCGAITHAVEPNPALAGRIRSAALPRVTVHETAVGDVAGSADLYIPLRQKRGRSRRNDPSATLLDQSGDGLRIPVKVSTLDSLQLAPVAFMKIDVEGYEEKALRGGWDTIVRDRPALLIELEDSVKKGCRGDIVGLLGTIGYSAWYYDGGGWLPETGLNPEQIGPSGRRINNFLFLNGSRRPPSA
jgi:FkbM family methyltransferase